MNRLSETSQSGLTEVAQMPKAISEGDLTERIDTDYHVVFGELKDDASGTGEPGRGFTVVATEVRGLAARSAGAAQQIKRPISESVHKIEEGARLALGQTLPEDAARIEYADTVRRLPN